MKINFLYPYISLFFLFSLNAFGAQIHTLQTFSASMNKKIPALVITPDNYMSNTERYPVVYLLHGYGDSYKGGWITKAKGFETLADKYNLLIVLPDGNFDSWYLDSPIDSTSRYETYITKELIEAVDNNYRTINNRKGRAITGLSMGGHGALFLAIAHTDIFSAAGSMSGGVDFRNFPNNWGLSKVLGDINSYRNNWDQSVVINKIEFLKPNELDLIIDCGVDDFFYSVNVTLHKRLKKRKIPHDFISRPGGHTWEYWKGAIEYQILFMARHFEKENIFIPRKTVSVKGGAIMNGLGKNSKIVIYQVLPRLYGNLNNRNVYNGTLEENGCGKFSMFNDSTFNAIKRLGTTHIWYTGVIEHATKTDYSRYGIHKDHSAIVKGQAGSPYAIKDYYDIDPDLTNCILNRIHEFKELVERTHQAGLKVIIDFIPNHVSREYNSDAKPPYIKELGQGDSVDIAFSPKNNFYYKPGKWLELTFCSHEEPFKYNEFPAKVTGNDVFFRDVNQNDWYETIKLNYSVNYWDNNSKHFDPIPDTWHKMLDILLYWSNFGIDGFRCDMAEMVPIEFWSWAIANVKKRIPETIFIAEIYNPTAYRSYLYHGGFDYLYDKVGLYDTLRGIVTGQNSARAITSCWQNLEGINNKMLNFLENHDEQRIASDFFAGSPEKGFAPMIVSATMGCNPFMIYFGQELGETGMDNEGFSGQDGRTSIFDYWSIDSVRNWIQSDYNPELLTENQQNTYFFYTQLMSAIQDNAALSKGQFYDLMYANQNNPRINPDKHYVFLRKYNKELVLIAANFDDIPANIEINIPKEAFQILNIPDNKVAQITNLMTNKTNIGTITFSVPFCVSMGGNNGTLLKFNWINH